MVAHFQDFDFYDHLLQSFILFQRDDFQGARYICGFVYGLKKRNVDTPTQDYALHNNPIPCKLLRTIQLQFLQPAQKVPPDPRVTIAPPSWPVKDVYWKKKAAG